MKRKKLMKRLAKAVRADTAWRCWFADHENYWYLYFLDFSDQLLLGVEEDNFILDGFQLRPISLLQHLEEKNNMAQEIERSLSLRRTIDAPKLDLTDWPSAFRDLAALGRIVIIEGERKKSGSPWFEIGVIRAVRKKSILFQSFAANGAWVEPQKLPYDEITRVCFGDRYSTYWQAWFETHPELLVMDGRRIDPVPNWI